VQPEHRIGVSPGLITPSPHREMRHPDTSQESGTRGTGCGFYSPSSDQYLHSALPAAEEGRKTRY
ncbi:hypothetical protein KUCAC02_028853, partial [Chaenocephalus aceratus]